jgi:hypothetical protein
MMGKSYNYYPQGNGMVESTNKNLIQVFKKIIFGNERNWHKKLVHSLWESQITPKKSTKQSPYIPVYGKESIIPIQMKQNALAMEIGVEGMEEVSPLQA